MRKRDPHVFLVPQDSSHIERGSHMWCNRCGERVRMPFKVELGTFVKSMKGFDRAHAKCASLPIKAEPPAPPLVDPKDWLRYGEVGLSSKTIYSVMAGGCDASGDVPRDPDDFRRCHLLLEAFPKWRERMPEVAEKHPAWTALVREWPRLTSLYVEESPTGNAPKLYAAMMALEAEGSP